MDFLKRTSTTIRKFNLVQDGDLVFAALSGGKDSAAAALALKDYADKSDANFTLKGFYIHMGIPEFDEIGAVVKRQCEIIGIQLETISFRDYGVDLRKLAGGSRSACSACGVVKRQLMNKVPRDMGATKVATGHHMDDFLVFFFRNMLGRNFSWISKFKPLAPAEHPKLVTRIRPLFHVGGRECGEFVSGLGMPFLEKDLCPYAKKDPTRNKWYDELYAIESWQKHFRMQMVNSLIEASGFFREDKNWAECENCGEPTSAKVCAFCRVTGKHKRGR